MSRGEKYCDAGPATVSIDPTESGGANPHWAEMVRPSYYHIDQTLGADHPREEA